LRIEKKRMWKVQQPAALQVPPIEFPRT